MHHVYPEGNIENVDYEIIRTARELNLKVKAGRLKMKRLEKTKHPVIAKLKDGNYILLVSYKDNSWVILNPLKGQPETISENKLYPKLNGYFIIIGKNMAENDWESSKKFGFSWFIPTILKFKRQFISVLIAVFFIQILGILTPLMTQVVVDKVLSHHAINTLYTIAIGIFIVYIYELAISLCKSYLFVHTTNRIDVTLSAKLFHHLFGLPLKYFESRRVGETVARVRELDQIRSFLTGTPLSSMIDVVFIVVYIIVMFFYSVNLTWIVIASMPVFAILSLIITPLFKKSLDKKFETGAKAQSFLVESINGIHTVKAFALETSFEEKWGDLQSDYVKAGYKTSIISQTSNAVATFIQHVVDLIVLVFGAKAVIDGKLSIGQLVAFRMLAGRVSGPVLRLVQLWQEYQQASLSVKRIGDIFNSPVERRNQNSIQRLPKLKGQIRFENVRFRYRMDGSDVLHGISFQLKENKIYGLVGRSGSGKSTILRLTARFYDPSSGKVMFGGMDEKEAEPEKLMKKIAMVFQDVYLFQDTVANNIRYGKEDATQEEIESAAKLANCYDFIMQMPEGFDTMIGEGGSTLSGGEKQRISIARAMLKDAPIVILDEATANVDPENEDRLQKAIEELTKDKTIIMIAHRLKTVRNAD